MCGLVGVAGHITPKAEKAFRTLLILDSLRGVDSTGVASISRQAEPLVAKQLGNPFELFETKSWTKAWSRVNRVLIGHNRYATQGVVNKVNAHPFEFETLIGAHNGTISNKHVLMDHTDFDVDSMNLYHHMDKQGPESAIKDLRGAWSLTWWNRENGTINFLRNKERPMWTALSKDNNTLYWASEKWMLIVATSREGIDIDEPIETDEDVHYSMAVPRQVVDGIYLAKPIIKELKGAQGPVVVIPAKGFFPGHGTPRTIGTPTPASTTYSGTKGALLEVLSDAVDQHGSRYLVCYDLVQPRNSIRMYLGKKDKPETYVGRNILADIGNYYKNGAEKGFFKVNQSSARLVPEKLVDNSSYKIYKGANGSFMDRNTWENAHGSCSWCTTSIQAGDRHKFTKNKDILCDTCMMDTEITQYL